ncbi:hypothetical protein Ct9H90mP29_07210 [bacterium]|nr:MAG: hypothetical protein Ct9H90mP29_07210 [bacterium]
MTQPFKKLGDVYDTMKKNWDDPSAGSPKNRQVEAKTRQKQIIDQGLLGPPVNFVELPH